MYTVHCTWLYTKAETSERIVRNLFSPFSCISMLNNLVNYQNTQVNAET